MRNADHAVKDKGHYIGVVPAKVGDYAAHQTVGVQAPGNHSVALMGVSVCIESLPAGAVLELWMRQIADGVTAGDQMGDTNYYYAGLVCVPTRVAYSATGELASFGSAYWLLSAWPSVQLRVRNASGGGGAATYSWTAF